MKKTNKKRHKNVKSKSSLKQKKSPQYTEKLNPIFGYHRIVSVREVSQFLVVVYSPPQLKLYQTVSKLFLCNDVCNIKAKRSSFMPRATTVARCFFMSILNHFPFS